MDGYERSGSRGGSNVYGDRPNERRWWGLGANANPGSGLLPSNFGPISATATSAMPSAMVQSPDVVYFDPLNPPVENTRAGLLSMATNYRRLVTLQSMVVRQNIQQLMSQQAPQCVGTKSIFDPSVLSACEKRVSPERILTPLGVINVLDVPLGVQELMNVGEDGALERVYTPEPAQAFIAAYHAYVRSQRHMARIIYGEKPDADSNLMSRKGANGGCFECVLADATPQGYQHQTEADRNRYGMLGVIAQTRGPNQSLSIEQFISGESFLSAARVQVHTPDNVFATRIDGFPLNPIPPTRDEMKEPGGLYRYYARGGYLLYLPAIQGNLAKDGARDPIWHDELRYTSGYFMCPEGTLGAATEKVPDEGKGWIAYVYFAPGQFKIRLQMADRGAWNSVKKSIKDAATKLFSTICKLQPVANIVAQAAAGTKTCKRAPGTGMTIQQKMAAGCSPAEVVAAPGTPAANACNMKLQNCREGEPGCVCTLPPSYLKQQAMIAAGNAVLSATCGMLAPDVPIPCPPPPPGTTALPWWVIAGGVVLVGAILFGKNSKNSKPAAAA